MWSYTCTNPWFWAGANTRDSYPGSAPDCPPRYQSRGGTEGDGGIPTFALGRLGAIGDDPADGALEVFDVLDLREPDTPLAIFQDLEEEPAWIRTANWRVFRSFPIFSCKWACVPARRQAIRRRTMNLRTHNNA